MSFIPWQLNSFDALLLLPLQSQYSPRYHVDSLIQPSTSAPPTCEIKAVSSLERHGARHFTKGAAKGASATLKKVSSILASANLTVNNIPKRYRSLLDGSTIQTETDSLVPYGALQAYLSGKSSRQTYPKLADDLFVRGSGDPESDRVIVTAQYWKLVSSLVPFLFVLSSSLTLSTIPSIISRELKEKLSHQV